MQNSQRETTWIGMTTSHNNKVPEPLSGSGTFHVQEGECERGVARRYKGSGTSDRAHLAALRFTQASFFALVRRSGASVSQAFQSLAPRPASAEAARITGSDVNGQGAKYQDHTATNTAAKPIITANSTRVYLTKFHSFQRQRRHRRRVRYVNSERRRRNASCAKSIVSNPLHKLTQQNTNLCCAHVDLCIIQFASRRPGARNPLPLPLSVSCRAGQSAKRTEPHTRLQ